MSLSSIKERILDFLFPQHLKCHCCGHEAVVNDYGICGECESRLLFAPHIGRIEGVDEFVSPLLYNETARKALIPFKYNGALYKKEFITHFIELPDSWTFDYLVPVPLHPKRMKKRGYNQSELIANELAARYGLKVRTDLIARIKDTPKQARLNMNERRKNVHAAFKASKECKGLSLVLVDDVRTTGSTLRECALELRKRGAVNVYAVTAFCAMEEVINGK